VHVLSFDITAMLMIVSFIHTERESPSRCERIAQVSRLVPQPLADAIAAERLRQARSAGRERYAHVIGCIGEVARETSRIQSATKDAVDAIRDGRLDDARQWLDEVDALARSLQQEARTSVHALAAAREQSV
jgi:hypothetical protein